MSLGVINNLMTKFVTQVNFYPSILEPQKLLEDLGGLEAYLGDIFNRRELQERKGVTTQQYNTVHLHNGRCCS